jgi:hypothetical protein
MAIFTAIAGAIGAAFAGISGALAAVGASALGAAALQLGLGAALTFGASLFQSRKGSGAFQNPAPQYQAVINQSAGARRRGYGRAKLGGIRAFYDSKDGRLYQVIMLHTGEIDAIESFFIGDQEVSRRSDGAIMDAPFNISTVTSHVGVWFYLGASSQTADATMVLGWTGVWTSDHRLRGIAYIVATFSSPSSEKYLEVFPEGYNTPITAVARLSKVLDTRTGVTAWSENPAMILRDYLTHPDGYRRLTADDIDVPSFNAFANLCDEPVALAAGGTEPSYRAWGVYQLTDSPPEVIQRILSTCDGELYTTGTGKIAIRGGKWTAPTITIGPEHIISYDIEEGADALDRFNQLKIVYTSPLHDYQSQEATSWDDLADQEDRGIITQDFTIDMCPSPSQARRLAKIFIAKSNPRWRGTVRTTLFGLKARGERTITVNIPELAINTSFLITSHNLVLSDGVPIGCEIGVLALNLSAYSWATSEEGENPPPAQNTAPDLSLPVPQNLTLRAEIRGASQVVIASVDPPSRPDGALQAEISVDGSSLWEAMAVASDSFEAVFGALVEGETYAVRARFRFAGAAGAWSASETIEIDPE